MEIMALESRSEKKRAKETIKKIQRITSSCGANQTDRLPTENYYFLMKKIIQNNLCMIYHLESHTPSPTARNRDPELLQGRRRRAKREGDVLRRWLQAAGIPAWAPFRLSLPSRLHCRGYRLDRRVSSLCTFSAELSNLSVNLFRFLVLSMEIASILDPSGFGSIGSGSKLIELATEFSADCCWHWYARAVCA